MFWRQTLAAAALAGLTAAQVTTDCNPMEKDCPDNLAFGTEFDWSFESKPDGGLWETKVGPVTYEKDTGAHFQINKQGDSPTIRSKFYIFWGKVSFFMKASPGKGIISSFMLLSDDLDEIDWEFIGTDDRGTTNFYGKGIEDYTNGEYHDMSGTPHDDYHNYTTVWTEEALDFYINDQKVRTVKPEDSVLKNGTDIYPQTPMRIYFGIWAGGDPSLNEYTREWAGGDTDFDKGPYDMYVKDIYVEDFSSGKKYVWGDKTGDFESIEIIEGESEANKTIHKEPEKSTSEKFNELPEGAKIAVYAGAAVVAAAIIAGAVFYCIKQRRRGAEEARYALQQSETDRMDGDRMDRSGGDPNGFFEQNTEYNAIAMKEGGGANGRGDMVPNSPGLQSPGFENEKAWGAVGAGAAAGYAAAGPNRSQTSSPRLASPAAASFSDNRSQNGDPFGDRYAAPPSPLAPIRSPSPAQAYGAHRMQQSPPPAQTPTDGQFGFGAERVQSPGSPGSPRNFSSPRMSPAPQGYRQ